MDEGWNTIDAAACRLCLNSILHSSPHVHVDNPLIVGFELLVFESYCIYLVHSPV